MTRTSAARSSAVGALGAHLDIEIAGAVAGAADVPARALAVELVLEVQAQDQGAADTAEMQFVVAAAGGRCPAGSRRLRQLMQWPPRRQPDTLPGNRTSRRRDRLE
jgi:hypothetical protein